MRYHRLCKPQAASEAEERAARRSKRRAGGKRKRRAAGGGGAAGGSTGGPGGNGGAFRVAQYAEFPLHAGRGSLYVYVVVAPPSYEHAHTSTDVVYWHS